MALSHPFLERVHSSVLSLMRPFTPYRSNQPEKDVTTGCKKPSKKLVVQRLSIFTIVCCVAFQFLEVKSFVEEAQQYLKSTIILVVNADAKRPENKNDNFGDVIQNTTRLLYQNSPHLDFWLNQPPPTIFFYSLPDYWSNVSRISDCVDETMLPPNVTTNCECRWYPHVCNDGCLPSSNLTTLLSPGNRGSAYRGMRLNFNADVALVEWFRKYPYQTQVAEEADVFIVPVPFWSHCMCARTHNGFWKFKARCAYGFEKVEDELLTDHVVHHPLYRNRHVFIMGCDWHLVGVHKWRSFLKQSVSLSLGASEDCSEPCNMLLHPYLSTKRQHQPNTLLQQAWWQDNHVRDNTLTMAFGTPGYLTYRRRFYSSPDIDFLRNSSHQVQIMDFKKLRKTNQVDAAESLYTRSIFCMILPGDSPVQKRFFDALLSGCIPVSPAFNTTGGEQSGWMAGAAAISITYPFSRFHFGNQGGISYQNDVMVTFDGECGARCAVEAMDRVMRNTSELNRLRSNVRRYAPLFTYGLDDNAYKNVDAFSAIIVNMRHYVYSIQNR